MKIAMPMISALGNKSTELGYGQIVILVACCIGVFVVHSCGFCCPGN